MARFLAGVDRNIPWHITAFHPDYNMQDRGSTTATMLTRAAEIGVEEGLNFVYAGNVPGRVGEWENTRCPKCHQTVIERRGFHVIGDAITSDGKCPKCQQPIPGVW